MNRLREPSADEETRRLAFVRERALHDEVSLLNDARREGEEQGLKKGEQLGLEKGEQLGLEKGEQLGLKKGEQLGLEKGEQLGLKRGEQLAMEKAARNLIMQTDMDDATIASISGLPVAAVAALRAETRS